MLSSDSEDSDFPDVADLGKRKPKEAATASLQPSSNTTSLPLPPSPTKPSPLSSSSNHNQLQLQKQPPPSLQRTAKLHQNPESRRPHQQQQTRNAVVSSSRLQVPLVQDPRRPQKNHLSLFKANKGAEQDEKDQISEAARGWTLTPFGNEDEEEQQPRERTRPTKRQTARNEDTTSSSNSRNDLNEYSDDSKSTSSCLSDASDASFEPRSNVYCRSNPKPRRRRANELPASFSSPTPSSSSSSSSSSYSTSNTSSRPLENLPSNNKASDPPSQASPRLLPSKTMASDSPARCPYRVFGYTKPALKDDPWFGPADHQMLMSLSQGTAVDALSSSTASPSRVAATPADHVGDGGVVLTADGRLEVVPSDSESNPDANPLSLSGTNTGSETLSSEQAAPFSSLHSSTAPPSSPFRTLTPIKGKSRRRPTDSFTFLARGSPLVPASALASSFSTEAQLNARIERRMSGRCCFPGAIEDDEDEDEDDAAVLELVEPPPLPVSDLQALIRESPRAKGNSKARDWLRPEHLLHNSENTRLWSAPASSPLHGEYLRASAVMIEPMPNPFLADQPAKSTTCVCPPPTPVRLMDLSRFKDLPALFVPPNPAFVEHTTAGSSFLPSESARRVPTASKATHRSSPESFHTASSPTSPPLAENEIFISTPSKGLFRPPPSSDLDPDEVEELLQSSNSTTSRQTEDDSDIIDLTTSPPATPVVYDVIGNAGEDVIIRALDILVDEDGPDHGDDWGSSTGEGVLSWAPPPRPTSIGKARRIRASSPDSGSLSSLEHDLPSSSDPAAPRPTPKARILPPAQPTLKRGQSRNAKAWGTHRSKLALSLIHELDEHVFKGQLVQWLRLDRLPAKGGGKCREALPSGVEWSDRLKSTAGMSRWTRRQRMDGSWEHWCRIELSGKVLDSDEKIINTTAHEMCHLATWVFNGKDCASHGAEFKAWGRKVERFRGDIIVTTKHTYEIQRKYTWACVDCSAQYGRDSKSIDINQKVCGRCHGRLVAQFPDTPARPPTAYQAFVQKNFVAVKREMPGASQGEIMRRMGELWQKEKGEKMASSSSRKDYAAVEGLSKGLEQMEIGIKV